MTVKEFNIFYGDEYPYTKDILFKKTENGFELLDFEGNPIIRAYDVETTGEFHVFTNNCLFNDKYTTHEIGEDHYSGSVRHFKIVKKELEK